MVKVECDGCRSPYEIEERRIPAGGLKMRCPKCGKSLLVVKPGEAPPKGPVVSDSDLPAAPAKRSPLLGGKRPGGPPRPGAAAAPAPEPPAPPEPELPALVTKPRAAAKPRGVPAASPLAQPAAPAGFGELDLPPVEPATDDVWADVPAPDLPAPRAAAATARGLGRGDLPAAGHSTGTSQPIAGFGEIDLPSVGGPDPEPSGFGMIDLPAPSLPFGEEPAAASLPFGEAHLPTVGVKAPAAPLIVEPASGFGEIDLPAQSASLPAALGHPSPSARFGEIDLPSPSHDFGEIDLPAASDEGFPVPAPAAAQGGQLPAPGVAPLPAPGVAPLPAPGVAPLPPPAVVPSPVPRIAGPEVFAEVSLDEEEEDASLDAAFADPDHSAARPPPRPPPAPATTAPAPQAHAPAPPPPPARTAQPPAAAPAGDVGEEFSLGEPDMDLSTGETVPRPPPREAPVEAEEEALGAEEEDLEGAGVGGEVDLNAGGGIIGEVIPAPPPAAAVEEPPKRTKALKYLVAAIVIAAIGGGSLALVPNVGAFGAIAIGDRLQASAHAEALDQLKQRVRGKLEMDTYAAAMQALEDARSVQADAPRHGPTAAYAGFMAFHKSIRFGRRSEDEALGKQFLAISSPEDGNVFVLATAAQDTMAGQLARARQAVGAVLQGAPDDIDAAVLAGEIELSAKAPDQAVAAFQRAAGMGKTARTLFGLARAQLATGDDAGAEASAKAALEASPHHVGARLLLASIASQQGGSKQSPPAPITPAREAEALALLAKVTDDKAVRSAASDAELVAVFTLIGHIHLSRSRMTAAEQAFAAALKLDPQAVQALIGNGELFYRAGRFSEALARFEAAIRADADSVVAKVGAAKTWLSLERMKEAKDLLKKLREARPGDPLVAYWLGRTEEILGNKKEAEQAYLDAVKVGEGRPEVVDAYVALTRLLSGLGRSEEAQTRLTEASAKFPDLTALYVARGDLALQTGRYEDAKTEFQAALEKGEDLGTRYKLGVALRRMRDFEGATGVFDQVAAVDKDYPGLALERGLLFEETGQSERALESYADALRKAPNDVDLKLRVGSAQVMANHAKQAESILREVLKDRPNSAEANHFLGRALLVRGTNLAEAMRFLERAAEIDPNRAEYQLYVGWGANEAGQPGRAETALKRALELDKELGDAYWQRGVLLQKQGASRDALADLEIALEKRPSRYEAYATMALCFQDLGQWAQAEDAWRKAIAANDTIAEWHYRLGKIYATRGNRAGVVIELDKALTLAEAPDRTATPAWLFDAHFLLAEALRPTDPEKAIRHYRRFLATAPSDNAYRIDAQRALEALERQAPR